MSQICLHGMEMLSIHLLTLMVAMYVGNRVVDKGLFDIQPGHVQDTSM